MKAAALPLAALAAVLAGCATAPEDDAFLASSEAVRSLERETGATVAVARFSERRADERLPGHWRDWRVPSKRPTEYRLVATENGVALAAQAERSASGLYRRIRVDPRRHPILEWRWQVPEAIAEADARDPAREDSPVRVVVSFHGDAAKLDFEDRAKLRLARALTGRGLPYAMLMYVWSNELPVGTVVPNAHLGRIRMVVAGSGAADVGRWVEVRRDLLADYRRAFGEEPWDVVAVGVMTDSDNTGGRARGLYGDITFRAE